MFVLVFLLWLKQEGAESSECNCGPPPKKKAQLWDKYLQNKSFSRAMCECVWGRLSVREHTYTSSGQVTYQILETISVVRSGYGPALFHITRTAGPLQISSPLLPSLCSIFKHAQSCYHFFFLLTTLSAFFSKPQILSHFPEAQHCYSHPLMVLQWWYGFQWIWNYVFS